MTQPPDDLTANTGAVPAPAAPTFDAATREQLEQLIDQYGQQRDQLSRLVHATRQTGLDEAAVDTLLSQISWLDHARDQLVDLVNGIPSVNLVGTDLINTLRSLGWLRPLNTIDTPAAQRDYTRRKPRYRLIYTVLHNAVWTVSDSQKILLDVELFDISESGVGFSANRCLPKGAKVDLPFVLQTFRAVASVKVMNCVQVNDAQWRVGGLFTYHQ